ncbi:MAG TPA: hypothetical protein VGZ23_18155 [bacterium]|nr:hypothetical protein [bacterium]
MQPMLDDLELPQVQEIVTLDRRALAEHKPPGMAGSLLQNLGRAPTRVVLWGVATGPDARDFADKLDSKFRASTPVPFTTDIVADSKIDRVLIDDLRLQDLAGKPERFAYVLTLREFIKPVEPEDTSGLDAGILDEAKQLVDGIAGGLKLAEAFATGLERFVPIFSGFLSRLQQAQGAPGGP